MIPKKIHYCWFGKGVMPPLAIQCIDSWKRLMPDYELVLWDEASFDIDSVQFVSEAYAAKKFAFVTDYVRLYALYTQGGIYMDTDVEVIKRLDPFLSHPAFTGYEDPEHVPTGIMASEPKGEWVKMLLTYYDNRSFYLSNGKMDAMTNTYIITRMMTNDGFILNNKFVNFKDIVYVYPSDFFCPKSHVTGIISITDNSHCIHHFAGSWRENSPFKELIKKLLFYDTFWLKLFPHKDRFSN